MACSNGNAPGRNVTVQRLIATSVLVLMTVATSLSASAVTPTRRSHASHPTSKAPAARKSVSSSDNPVDLSFTSLAYDNKTQSTILQNVVISQGDLRVWADHASANSLNLQKELNFDDSRWRFDGNVRINAESRGKLHSDQAIVEFRNGRIAKATITGTPAEFEQKRSNSDEVARGRADQIVYDVTDGTVRLADNAWLTYEQNEVSGPLLVYNIREERLLATSPGPSQQGRVHITIGPRGDTSTDKSGTNSQDPAKPPASNPPNKPDTGKADLSPADPRKSGAETQP